MIPIHCIVTFFVKCRMPGIGLLFGAALLFAGLLVSPDAQAGAIVVGKTTTGHCTVSTIKKAIERAETLGGYNLILVTDDVANGVWKENLLMLDLPAGLQIEIVGGFNNCADLAPTGGKASIYGGEADRPVLEIVGLADVTLRDLWMEGGSRDDDSSAGGISFRGRGRLQLESVQVAQSRGTPAANGIDLRGIDGEARLEFSGGTQVTGQANVGIVAVGTAVVSIHGDGNSIHDNAAGLYLESPAFADIGATGPVLSNNAGYGLFIKAESDNSGRTTRLYSTDPARPLEISGNSGGAIHFESTQAPYWLCTRNLAIRNNASTVAGVSVVHAKGNHANIEMNGTNCEFPPEADIQCPIGATCRDFTFNTSADGKPLVAAVDGATIAFDRVLFKGNRASSILSTNLGISTTSASSITLTRSVVAYNDLRDNLFEALNGGVVDIWESTVKDNIGLFQISFVGINPRLLQMTNSILDQAQILLANEGLASAVRFTNVLAQNEIGTDGVQREIILGSPTYVDSFGRLAPGSLGIDYAPAGGGEDFDGQPRDIDIPGRPNVHGPRDLGAFEVQQGDFDAIFANGFDQGAG